MNVNYQLRKTKLLQSLKQHQADMMIISNRQNIRYLTGFSGNAATLLMSQDASYLITDYRYFERACAETSDIEVVKRDRDAERLGQCIARCLPSCESVAFEAAHFSVEQWRLVAADLPYQNLFGVAGCVESLREVKDELEISYIQRAAQIADESLGEMLSLVREGVQERDLALEIDYKMRSKGSEGISFDTILLFGERSALPHGNPSNRRLKVGDLLLVDFGAVVNGYRSDMTRTYVFGKPTAKQTSIFNTVQHAQQRALESVKQGIDYNSLNQVAHQVLANSPYAQFAGEGLGHSLGLDLHEQPFIKPNVPNILQAGNVITIEPGIYIPEFGGVRLEEDIVVTEHGHQCLTKAPQTFEL
ncbi:aminopeptidase P family protein [Pseudoalteromonas luteoviolacea]|uniref:M24 family metallopeptidase n=1 Tax=Pseudoalteromonas luteoviolacea TaxID=43657 RepID=UPI001B363150|nr:Xaa-Pro peptidase family protein [Pseudoalteromonas luteoviolacea]MBQ4811205.1 aminopeptidase P family protein [Pseudoalteromonas luteoviolacea]